MAPFASADQEIYMQIHLPELWKSWVQKYGHHKEYKDKLRQNKRRKAKFSKTKNSKRRKNKR